VRKLKGKMMKAAIIYFHLGWVPIPLRRRSKKPLVKWKPYQKEKPTIQQVKKWWTKWPSANIGIITGKLSGIFVIDTDGPEGKRVIEKRGNFPPTPKSRSPRGIHYYLKYPSNHKVSNSSDRNHSVDVKSDGSYIVAPPSIHPSGKKYSWIKDRSPFKVDPVPPPDGFWGYLKEYTKSRPYRIDITPSNNWTKIRGVIIKNPRIRRHWEAPKPQDRSGHDWELACLCVEEGITDNSQL
jgi:hypothetical protein